MIQTCEVELRWRASQLTLAIATCAGVALAAAVVAGRWQLIAFAAPLLGVLCSISWQRPVPVIQVHGDPDSQRCFENEHVRVTVWVTTESVDAAVELTVSALAGMQFEALESVSRRTTTVSAVAQRWGRYPIRARVAVVARGGLLMGAGTVDAAEIVVFPLTPPQSTPLPQ